MAVHFFKKGAGRIKAEGSQRGAGFGAGRRCMSFLLAFAMVFSVAAVGLTAPVKAAEEKATLRFDRNGEFKILQIADVQENYGKDKDSAMAKKTYQMIQQAIAFSDPDLVVFTGDQLDGNNNSSDIESCIQTICRPVVEAGIPFMVCFGNHDYSDGGALSGDVTKADQVRMYQAQKGCLALLNDPEYPSDGDGRANQNLTIKSSKDGSKDAYNLWFFDSLSSSSEPDEARCVTQAQIDWYKARSDKLAEKNGGTPLPSLAFQHICVPEIYGLLKEVPQETPNAVQCENNNKWYIKDESTGVTGMLGEGPCPNGYSDFAAGSDQFRAWQAQQDVQGAFFGHDHLNDIQGTVGGIFLAQTKTIGAVSNYHNDNCDDPRVPANVQKDLEGTNGYRTITIYENPTEEDDVIPGTNFNTESVYEKMIAQGQRLDLTRLEATLDLFPTYADSYYTQETIEAFHTAKDTAKTGKRAARWRPYQAYDAAKQAEIDALAAAIENAYAKLEAAPSPADLDRLAQAEITMGTTGVIRVGAADNSLDKQEYGNTIQEHEVDYVNHTGTAIHTVFTNETFPTKGWKSTEDQRTITFEKQGASNIRIANTGYYGPIGGAPNPTIQFGNSGQGVSNSAEWVITGTAYAGTSLEFTITYDYDGRTYNVKKYMYVDTIISPPGWNTYTRRTYGVHAESIHVSTLTSAIAGVSVYPGVQNRTGDPISGNDFNNQTGYFPYGKASDGNSTKRGFGDWQFVPKGWDRYQDSTNQNDPGRYYGLIQWSPDRAGIGSRVWYSGQSRGDARSKSGNRAKAEVYVDKRQAVAAQLNLTYWQKENKEAKGNNPYSNGLYVTNWDGDSQNNGQYNAWGYENLPGEPTDNWNYYLGHDTTKKRGDQLNGRGSSFNYTLINNAPVDGSISTVMSQVFTKEANGTSGHNETYNAWLLNFYVFDTTDLYALVQHENEMNRQSSTYRDIGKDNQPNAFGRYLEALKKANHWLTKPDTNNQQDIDSALNDLNWHIDNLIRIYQLDIETPPEQIGLTYEMDNAQATVLEQEIALNPIVSSGIPTNYAQLQVNGSVASTSFVLENSTESPVRFEVVDNGNSRMLPGDCIGDPVKGLQEGIYSDYGLTVRALVDDTTPAGIYTGYLTIRFINAPEGGSYNPAADGTQVFPVTIPITLEVRSTYVVTIPADTQIPFFNESTVLGGVGTNFTAKAQIPSGDRVSVTVDSGRYFDEVTNKRRLGLDGNTPYYLPYDLNERIVNSEGHLSREPFSGVTLTMGAGQSAREASLEVAIIEADWNKVPIASYSDTLTFTVDYTQSAANARSMQLSGQVLRPSILDSEPEAVTAGKPKRSAAPQASVSIPDTTAAETTAPKAPVTTAPAVPETAVIPQPDTTAAPPVTTAEPATQPATAAPDTEPASQKETATVPPAPAIADPEESADPVQ